MNIDYLRWILAGCGLILVIGIYVRERFRRRSIKNRERLPSAGGFFRPQDGDLFDEDLDLPSMRADSFDPLIAEFASVKSRSDLEESAPVETVHHEADGPLNIIQIKVTAVDGDYFPGIRLINALRAVGLKFGSMDIFHRHLNSTQTPLFSVVNLIEPGTFPVDDPSHFESPGVVFFLQVAVSAEPLLAFDEMIRTVHVLAACLGGEVRDEDNELLTVEKTETIRESLLSVAGWSAPDEVKSRP